MSLKKIKNYFDPRENLILNRKDEDEDEITFEEARDIGAQRVRTERSGMNATPSTEKQYTGTQTASMPLMTELQKNNLSFDDARQLGMQNHALDYQREIRERALKMMKDAGNKKSPYEALSQEDKSSLDRLYSLKTNCKPFQYTIKPIHRVETHYSKHKTRIIPTSSRNITSFMPTLTKRIRCDRVDTLL